MTGPTWSPVLFIAAAAIAAMATGQQTQPRPGPGSGIVQVDGTVDVTSVKGVVNVQGTVNANQSGAWNVAVTNAPTVSLASPVFLRAGSRYQVIWTTGESESITVSTLGGGGWVRVAGSPERWVNLTSARSVTAN